MQSSSLILQQLELTVNLGWSIEEREHAQQVNVDIQIDYPQLPTACISDELSEATCYDRLSSSLQKVCASKSYKLIEALAYDLFSQVKSNLCLDANVKITVAKNRPMQQLLQSRFVISD